MTMRLFFILLVLSFNLCAESVVGPQLTFHAGGITLPQDEARLRQVRIRLLELKESYETKLLAIIPAPLLKRIENQKIIIRFEKNAFFGNDPHAPKGLFKFVNDTYTVHLLWDWLFHPNFERLFLHEVLHAIHKKLNPFEVDWVKEGLAQVFEEMVLGSLNFETISSYYKSPLVSFFKPYSVISLDKALYGQHLLYFYYLIKQCGGKKLFWNLLDGAQGSSIGQHNIDRALQEHDLPQCINFKASLKNYTLAKIYNRRIEREGRVDERYFLMVGQRRQELKIISQAKTWNSLHSYIGPFIPLETTQNLKVHVQKNCLSCEFYWLSKDRPFNVLTQEPSDETKHQLIFFKTVLPTSAD
jgi:hypothetical protein